MLNDHGPSDVGTSDPSRIGEFAVRSTGGSTASSRARKEVERFGSHLFAQLNKAIAPPRNPLASDRAFHEDNSCKQPLLVKVRRAEVGCREPRGTVLIALSCPLLVHTNTAMHRVCPKIVTISDIKTSELQTVISVEQQQQQQKAAL